MLRALAERPLFAAVIRSDLYCSSFPRLRLVRGNDYRSVLGCTWARPDLRPIESHATGPRTGTKIVTSTQIRAWVEVRRLAVRAIEKSATTIRAMTRTETIVHAMSYPTGMIGLIELPMSSAYGEESAYRYGTGSKDHALSFVWSVRTGNALRALFRHRPGPRTKGPLSCSWR